MNTRVQRLQTPATAAGRLLLQLLLLQSACSGGASQPRRDSEAGIAPPSPPHFHRRQQRDEFQLSLHCNPALLPRPDAYDVNRIDVAAAGDDGVTVKPLSWLRRRVEAHTLAGSLAPLLPVAIDAPICTHAHLLSSASSTAAAAAAGHATPPPVAFADAGVCSVSAAAEAVQRLLPSARLLLVFNAPPGGASAIGSGGGLRRGAIAAESPTDLAVVLYERVELAKELMASLRQGNRSCSVTYKFQASDMDGLINRTSVLFVSVSFILLMIISLSWLIFYYVQRFRYLHAKERLSVRLNWVTES